jgi:hypothetical protein
MDAMEFHDAQTAFAEVVRLAPDWLPGRINLGIALMNCGSVDPRDVPVAQEVFAEVLRRDPDNLHAHFCLGMLSRDDRDPQLAVKHFEAVLHGDPNDASTWYWLGLMSDEPERKEECFNKALELQPALSAALYSLARVRHSQGDDMGLRALLEQFLAFENSDTPIRICARYGEMGRYAEPLAATSPWVPQPVGPLPLFIPRDMVIHLPPGARWARVQDFGREVAGMVQAQVRRRFGATIVVLDYDGDGRPDLFLAGAVVEDGKVRNLLLHNDGDGTFTDMTSAARLAVPHPILGCCVADWDNDGKPDLVLTGVGSQLLFRNKGDGTFEDVNAIAGLDKEKSVCLAAAFIDLDLDGNLDLLLAEFAPTPPAALAALDGGRSEGTLLVFLNKGEVPQERPDQKPAPHSGKFHRADNLAAMRGSVTGFAALDVDRDADTDLLCLSDGMRPMVAINDRLLRFRRQELPETPAPWNGALVLDANHDGMSDLLILPSGQPPRLLVNRFRPGDKHAGNWFASSAVGDTPLLHAIAMDIDLDGWTDVVGLSAGHLPLLLHNEGGMLVPRPQAFGPDTAWPPDLVAVTVCDLFGNDFPDLVVWSESKGLDLAENLGNGNRALRLVLQGLSERLFGTRCNAEGFGTWVTVNAGTHWAGQENTTLAAGLAQSRQPLLLGLGPTRRADLLRLRWPDGTRQAQMDVSHGPPTRVQQTRRPVW